MGAGENSELAYEPIRQRVNGVGLIVAAYLAIEPNWFSAGPNEAGAASWEKDSGARQIVELVATGDVVVVALHLHLGGGGRISHCRII